MESTRVTITPDKKHIYITVNIVEGVPYKVEGFSLEGNLIGKRAEILKLITLKTGTVFSRKSIIEIQANISRFFGDYGYGMSDIRIDPIINDKNRQIFIKFVIDPGHRVYVRHIDFIGNTKTHAEVMRREMRQQEGSVFSLSKINESKRRLANLGYLQDIDYRITPVPNDADQVDLTYSVKEASAITAAIQGGYSDADGFLYGANLNDSNVFGTGKTASIRFDNSIATQYYSLGYYDPYFTINNIGLSFNAYFQKSDPGKKNLSSYSADIYGALASFIIPLSDYNKFSIGAGFEHIELKTFSDTRPDVKTFIDDSGSVFNQFKIVTGWSHSNFDRAIFPTKGFAQQLNLQVYGPITKKSLEFYKIDYDASWYQPLIKGFILHTNAEIGYGNGFGKTKNLPFFKNFFAGGMNSVRGFEDGSLGRCDRYGHATGGNLLTTARASIVIPAPMQDTVPS